MRNIKNILASVFLVALCALACGCGEKSVKKNAEILDTLYAPKYAKHFVLLESGKDVILRVLNPWQGANDIAYDYNLSKKVPQRIITMSTSHSAFFDALGCGDRIVGVSGPQWVSNPEHRGLPDIGYGTSLHYETIVGLECDVLTTYELSGENSSASEKLASLRVPTLFVADYLENSPLAKAEWVVAFGAIVSKIESAEEIFYEVEDSYNATKDMVASFLSDKDRNAPKVVLNSPYKDVWYMPGDSSYMVQLLKDAGGDYVGAGVADNVSRPVSMENAFVMFSKADLWLNPAADIRSVAQLEKINSLVGDINIPVYTNAAKEGESGSDFWESGVLRCDVVLKDLAAIFYPELQREHSLVYHWQLP